MARLTDEQWSIVRADYEVRSLSNYELAEKHGVTETAIRKKAKQYGWVKGQSSHLVDEKVSIIKGVAQFSSQSSRISSHHNIVIDDEATFKMNNDKDLQEIQNVVNKMVRSIDNPTHALALMNATVKHREARLGKSPDTAIQINNNPVQDGIKIELVRPDAS